MKAGSRIGRLSKLYIQGGVLLSRNMPSFSVRITGKDGASAALTVAADYPELLKQFSTKVLKQTIKLNERSVDPFNERDVRQRNLLRELNSR